MPRRNGDKPTKQESIIAFAKVQEELGLFNIHPFDGEKNPLGTKHSVPFNQEHAYRIKHDEAIMKEITELGYFWNPTKSPDGKVTWQVTKEYIHDHVTQFNECDDAFKLKMFRDGARVDRRKSMTAEVKQILKTVKLSDRQKVQKKANSDEAYRIAANGIVSMCKDGLIPNNPETDKPWTYVEAVATLKAQALKKEQASETVEAE